MTQESNQRLTKNERREAARMQAKAAREAQVKREKRNRLMLQGGVVLAVLAVIAIIALIVTQMVKPAGPGPENMSSGGVVFEGEDYSVRETPSLKDDEKHVAQQVNRDEPPLDVIVYVDYMCPICGQFEQQAASMLDQWVGSGQATLQIYPINFLDEQSKGSRYSTRAANALACVVEQQPEAAWNMHGLLLSPKVQPAEQTAGLTNDRLLEVAVEAGAMKNSELKQCIAQVPFSNFITKNTRQALTGPLVGLAEGAQIADGQGGLQPLDKPQHITGTPTVLVNGQQAPMEVTELEQFMLKIFGELSGETIGGDEDAEEEKTE